MLSFRIQSVCSLVVGCVCLLLSLVADCKADKLAVVDIQRVVNESILGKAARKNLEAQVTNETARLETLKQEMIKLQDNLKKQASVLSGAALQAKQDELRRKERELQSSYQDKQRELARKNEEEIGSVVQQVDKIVKRLADKERYRFVLERDPRAIVYASDQVDITKKVIEILDEEKLES